MVLQVSSDSCNVLLTSNITKQVTLNIARSVVRVEFIFGPLGQPIVLRRRNNVISFPVVPVKRFTVLIIDVDQGADIIVKFLVLMITWIFLDLTYRHE